MKLDQLVYETNMTSTSSACNVHAHIEIEAGAYFSPSLNRTELQGLNENCMKFIMFA